MRGSSSSWTQSGRSPDSNSHLHRDAVDGLGLDVLDAVDVGADRVLAVGRKALLHLSRVEAGVLPDHRGHGMSISGKISVGISTLAVHSEEQDQRRHHRDGMRIFQCKANDSKAKPSISPGQPQIRVPWLKRRQRDPPTKNGLSGAYIRQI